MAVKIRLQRRGRKKLPLYHIIIADSRAPRDGRFIEYIGSYNPLTKPATVEIDRDKAFEWLMKGAQPTDTVRAILKFKGVMYRKHLSRGVSKGALTQEQADSMYHAWIEEKESKIAKRRKAAHDEISAYHDQRSGKAKPAKEKIEEAAAAEATEADVNAPAEEALSTDAPAVEAVQEETPAAEEMVAEAAEPAKEDETETPPAE